ncbi:MAG: hypothetical protein IMX04_09165 [Candidatus Carbobacillus altaicus]|uniref:Flagellar protein FliT n=1 Tax=Candidatus Carbonibacillus altaicus TaxID=2163959 RepID=A0A2R6Y0M3_9BACL|nr:hypothetical protein [Candidatus Carbobacillus altaicus]PTQ56195.1 MAG: hypothetical protein BSOLF_0582 [Candidatus Carbobacillus altaicus]
MTDYATWRRWTEEALSAARERDFVRLEAALEKRDQWIEAARRSFACRHAASSVREWPSVLQEEAKHLEEKLREALLDMQKDLSQELITARRTQVMEQAYQGTGFDVTGGFFDVKR